MRRTFHLPVLLLTALSVSHVHAQDLAGTCHASSSYDVTLKTDGLVFDRASPAPFHVDIQHGTLRTDGVAVRLNPEDQDRLSLFERELRTLAPRARKVAQNGVDMAVQAMRAEASSVGMSDETRAEFERRLSARAVEIKQRIAASQSTHDWQSDATDQYASQIASDLVPLIAADIGQQAVNAALSGDMQTASDLRDRASDLASQLEPRLQRRMQALRPQIQALCPSIQRLADLQQGVRGSNRQPLNLLQVGP
ncbi:MAG TPA: DUF2884 family protein [Rhodanobacter sp.]